MRPKTVTYQRVTFFGKSIIYRIIHYKITFIFNIYINVNIKYRFYFSVMLSGFLDVNFIPQIIKFTFYYHSFSFYTDN